MSNAREAHEVQNGVNAKLEQLAIIKKKV